MLLLMLYYFVTPNVWGNKFHVAHGFVVGFLVGLVCHSNCMGEFRHSHCMGVFHVCSWFCNMMLVFYLICQFSRFFLFVLYLPSTCSIN